MMETLFYIAGAVHGVALIGFGYFFYCLGKRDEIRLVMKELDAGGPLPRRLRPEGEDK